VTFIDLRATTMVCELLGGYMKSSTFGWLWYQAIPGGLSTNAQLIPVLFSGAVVSSFFLICLLPALAFRPHPFLATVIGYAVSFCLALNLIADPILSLSGLGGVRWQLALSQGAVEQKLPLVATYIILSIIFILTVRFSKVRMWFSELSRPNVSLELKEALSRLQAGDETPRTICNIGLLYDKAGLRRQSRKQLKKIKNLFGPTTYSYFLESVLCYRQRKYKKARQMFVATADLSGVEGQLKADLLAAAACAAFAQNDWKETLNLCDRALEFDHRCLMARMVKVDVYLKQGNREKAGDELLLAMSLAGDRMELERKLPLDCDESFAALVKMESIRVSSQPTAELTKTSKI